jgi:hypothetical protein
MKQERSETQASCFTLEPGGLHVLFAIRRSMDFKLFLKKSARSQTERLLTPTMKSLKEILDMGVCLANGVFLQG